jgi:hypothetical protein
MFSFQITLLKGKAWVSNREYVEWTVNLPFWCGPQINRSLWLDN